MALPGTPACARYNYQLTSLLSQHSLVITQDEKCARSQNGTKHTPSASICRAPLPMHWPGMDAWGQNTLH